MQSIEMPSVDGELLYTSCEPETIIVYSVHYGGNNRDSFHELHAIKTDVNSNYF